ncbi:MAG TPA: zinc-dependent alcohol dehydrogenase family protein [Polyangiaceae bacterium]
MFAMLLDAPGAPLRAADLEPPAVGSTQVRIRVRACGVCRTDLHLVDGELPEPMLPVIPGHEVIGAVEERGREVTALEVGERVGVPWLGFTCGACDACLRKQENLCPNAKFTGYTLHGGYAGELVAEARYCFRIPDVFEDSEAAPLMCAGLIGYRALSIADAEQRGERVGLYGFGAAAHILAQLLVHQGRDVFAFVRPGDAAAKAFARSLGARWAGDATETPPVALDSAILFAPVGALVPQALAAVRPGGRVVCGGIHMSDIPSFPYRLLWQERQLVSVANLTRKDGDDFLPLAAKTRIRTAVTTLPLSEANQALTRLRNGEVQGALVLQGLHL